MTFIVHGGAGTGSVPVEAALLLAGADYRVVDRYTDNASVARDAATPMGQVPALILPTGERITESCAILLHIAEAFPEARLGPLPGDPRRPAFLRWMAFVASAIYSLYWIRDEPSRLAATPQAQAVIMERTAERIAFCWGIMGAGLSPGRHLLGDELTVLDLYVAVASRWRPRRRRFYAVAPALADPVRRVDADPRLEAFWAERYPFEGDWE